MKSIHRIGLTIAGLVSVVMLSGVFVVQGYVAAKQTTAQVSVQPTAQTAPSLAPEIVYISPAAPAPVAQTAAPAKPPPVIHVVVPGYGDDDEGSDS